MFIQPFRIRNDVVLLNGTAREFLNVADAIGHRICAQAVWHDDRCNWLGMEPLERGSAGLQPSATYRTLGPDLYSGTSGVALFLAELFGETGDPLLRRTAMAAMRHALARADAILPSSRLGLFSGWFGIALVAARVWFLLGEEDLQTGARLLLQRAFAEKREPDEFDLMSGRTGAIAALVVLNCIFDDLGLIDFAVRLADELIETADKKIGYSWESPSLRNHHNLTGFSHGASGPAYALLELHEATGISKYREAALLAFEYERHWFNAEIANWPDFRKNPSSPSGKKHTYPYMTFWCHGAPGMALARLRAYEMTGNERFEADAIAALKTTRASIESALNSWAGNFSLCHGLAGNAEVLIYGAEILRAEREENMAAALAVARTGVERYAVNHSQWPCGTHTGETPNLMLGMAGIGHYYLRLWQPTIPSILLLNQEAWSRRGARLQSMTVS
jgi:lantibiotic biosynthesis protein